MRIRVGTIVCMLVWIFAAAGPLPADAQDAGRLVEAAFDYWRGQASYAVVTMTIHRPDWERRMTLKAWTQGQDNSLFRIVAPPKDEGNGTLKKGREMWMYNPKINRIIKVPPSMMSQAWMGSDFSNNDLAKTDSLITDYRHTVTGTETRQGHTVYRIESQPNPRAPVVWGMLQLEIRDDHILLREAFFDEDGRLVKELTGEDIVMLGGRLFPRSWKMQQAGAADEYTSLWYEELTFKSSLPDRIFTLSNLRSPQ